jgi:hypothetical protein
VLERLYDKMETELLEYCAPDPNAPKKWVAGILQGVPGRSFTKTYLARTYELSALEVRNFLKLMEERDVLCFAKPVETNRWFEEAWTIRDRPTPKTVMPRVLPPKGTKKHLPGRMHGKHLCKRCGTQIAGSGRHAKSLRGHTQAVCDVAMVGQIHSE